MNKIEDEILSEVSGGDTLDPASEEFPGNEFSGMFNGSSSVANASDLPSPRLPEGQVIT